MRWRVGYSQDCMGKRCEGSGEMKMKGTPSIAPLACAFDQVFMRDMPLTLMPIKRCHQRVQQEHILFSR